MITQLCLTSSALNFLSLTSSATTSLVALPQTGKLSLFLCGPAALTAFTLAHVQVGLPRWAGPVYPEASKRFMSPAASDHADGFSTSLMTNKKKTIHWDLFQVSRLQLISGRRTWNRGVKFNPSWINSHTLNHYFFSKRLHRRNDFRCAAPFPLTAPVSFNMTPSALLKVAAKRWVTGSVLQSLTRLLIFY